MKAGSMLETSPLEAVFRYRRRTVVIAVLKSVFRVCRCNRFIKPAPGVDGTEYRSRRLLRRLQRSPDREQPTAVSLRRQVPWRRTGGSDPAVTTAASPA